MRSERSQHNKISHRLLLIGPGSHILGGVSVCLNHYIKILRQLQPDVSISFINAGTGGKSLVTSIYSFIDTIRELKQSLIEAVPDTIHISTGCSSYRSIVRDTLIILYLRHIIQFKGRVVTQFHGGRPKKKHAWLLRKICHLSDILIFLTKAQRELFIQVVDQQMPPQKDWDPYALIIPNTVAEGGGLTESAVEKLLQHRWQQNPRRLLFMGRIITAKGILDTVELLSQLDDSFVLDVAGEGPDMETARQHADRFGVAERVNWLGRVEGTDKNRLLRRSFALLFPSRYPEGQPMTLLEAMSVGLPLISYPGPDGVLSEMFAGLALSPVVSSREEMGIFLRRLSADFELYRNLGISLYQRFQSAHAPEVVGRKLLSVYGFSS